MTQKSKFLQWIDFRIRITIQDGRMMVGTFLAYDKHMNVVLSDTDEYRIVKKKDVQKQIKRTLGLVIIRGENIISLTAEAPPAQKVEALLFRPRRMMSQGLGKPQPSPEQEPSHQGSRGNCQPSLLCSSPWYHPQDPCRTSAPQTYLSNCPNPQQCLHYDR